SCSPSTCWATPSATSSTPASARADGRAARGALRAGGRARTLRARARHPGPRHFQSGGITPMSKHQLQTIVETLRSKPVIDRKGRGGGAGQALGRVGPGSPVAATTARKAVGAGGTPAEWVSAPDVAAGRAVLYLHGGGCVIGSINTHRSLAARISRAS